jgi:hypothetical protein
MARLSQCPCLLVAFALAASGWSATYRGGGAVLSGADPAPKAGWRENAGVFALDQRVEVKFLFGPDVCYAAGKSPTELLPEQIATGDGNRRQDCPPMEVVLEVLVPTAAAAQDVTLYLDDLEVELAAN